MRLEGELNEKIQRLTKEIEDLKRRLDESFDETQVSESNIITPGILSAVLKDLSSIETTANQLSKANNDISVAVSPGSAIMGLGGASMSYGVAQVSRGR